MRKILFVLLPFYLIATSFVLPKIPTEKQSFRNDTLSIAKNSESIVNLNLSESQNIFTALDFMNDEKLDEAVFEKAYKGFEKLKKSGQLAAESELLTIADFSKSSNTKRLWVIDLANKKILFNALVAHGMGTGEEFAEHFSNTDSSHQSSLGFYVTETTYNGNNGYSLKLEGMDKGYNDAAFARAIVMHGADYVNENFAAAHKRIGRSWGCPAISRELAEPIINTIKGKNCLFIYYPDENYLNSSEWLKS
ncbi:murein L,D-transpeptidase catalytic domain family protein [Halpernia frigidisoli]|uniref:L,D-transpeptidase catalytic domain n=1 Tax=Halpernia frigidisoli TaxID=1125876 RepID=A0A1I3GWB3_9FLAO|nr:murein L,D-transpeptidase catalytic domain family protein [Halpernia frigidisoli]SFI27865.1 L,D-transpeptidase catalytic domain [Halpernia frigidisoli]